MVTTRRWRYKTRNKITKNGTWIKRKPAFSTIYLVPQRMIMVKTWLLAKCMHTLMFRCGVGQEMEVENIKNWKYVGFSIKCSRVHGYATDMNWICQLLRTYSVWECLLTQTRLNRHGICYKELLLSAQNRKLRTLLIPRFKKTQYA